VNKFLRLFLLFGVCLSLSCGCSKPDKPMPLTKEKVANYMQNMETAIKSITSKEVEEAKGNPDKQKQMYYKTFVEPMEKMGYSYDKTISVIATQVLAKSLRTTDSVMTMMVSDLLALAKNSRAPAYQFGFISKETKELLDQVSLIFPR
jgi:ribonucleotide reductase alpha subunit